MTDLPDRPLAAADDLLAVASDALVAASRDVPERAYVSMGLEAFDCEQLVVTLERIYSGEVGEETDAPQRCTPFSTGVYNVSLIRCVHTVNAAGGAPSVDELRADGEALLADAGTIWFALVAASHDLTYSEGGQAGIGALEAVDTQGGLAGFTVAVAVPLGP